MKKMMDRLTGLFLWIDELGELWITKKRLERKDLLIPVSCGASFFEQALNDFRRTDTYPAATDAGTPPKDVPVCPALPAYRQKVGVMAQDLEQKFKQGALTWDELYSFLLILLPMYPPLELRSKQAALRDQFYQRAPKHTVTSYERSAPPALGPTSSYEAVLSDALFLQAELAKIDTYRPHQELKRNKITFELYISLIVVLIAELIFGTVVWLVRACVRDLPLGAAAFPFIIIVMMLGALGSAVSSQRRLQEGFDADSSILNSTRYVGSGVGVKLAPFQGSVFAAVLLFILYSGLANALTAGILPNLTQPSGQQRATSGTSAPASPAPIASPSAAATVGPVASMTSSADAPNSSASPTATTGGSPSSTGQSISPGAGAAGKGKTSSGAPDRITRAMLFMFGPSDTIEYAKMLVYAFLAGFAERLVPDTLDRLTRSKT